MKKLLGLLLVGMLVFATACGGGENKGGDAEGGSTGAATGEINVVSREDGSGTRGAFVELLEIKDDAGDHTTETAEITNSTSVMLTTVSGDANAIGYASLGAIDDSIKALEIDGAPATKEAIKDGSYKVARPFLVTSPKQMDEVSQDFMNFIYSEDAKKIIEEEGYIAEETKEYTSAQPSGTITITGSSSVSPLMEKLVEAYAKVNSNATVQVQQNDSTTGITSTINKSSNLGMASRNLTDEEAAKDIEPHVIATDGIAIIVNTDNGISGLTADQVKQIYTGEITSWDDVK